MANANPPPDTDRFLQDLFADLSRGGFGATAWRTFWARAWQRSREQRAEAPERRRSYLAWAAMGLLLGTGVFGLAYADHTPKGGLTSFALWPAWYLVICLWTLGHLGRIRTDQGVPYDRFLLPNGLSFLRLGLAPLAAQPILLHTDHATPAARAVLFAALALLVLSDLADGWLARRLDQQSALGRVLDPMADLALLAFLAWALYRSNLLPGLLLVLLLIRYPGALLGAIVIYFARGPARTRITATRLGKATTAITAALLLFAAGLKLLHPTAVSAVSLRYAFHGLSGLVALNVVYLLYRAARWR